MEAQKLRFVRCPKCHQLLVEYPSIPVYQCGGCGTVLRAKNRGVPVTHPDQGSGEQNNSPLSLEGSIQTSKSISSDEQKVVLAYTEPSENVVEGSISSVSKDDISCENVNPQRTLSVGESATSGEVGGEECCSPVDGNAPNPELMIKEADDKGTEANSSLKLIENVQNVEVTESGKGEKGYSMDDASVGSKVAAVHSMESDELADHCNNVRGEIESMDEQKLSASNKNMNCHEVAETNKLYKEDEAKFNNMLSQREDKSQPYEGLLIESYEDLIEELERSLSLTDDEEDFSDAADNNGLNDALHNQISSRRFLSAGKLNDDPRSDPHGRLIEELERSFSDAEEPLEHHVGVAEKDIQDEVHGKEHDKDQQFLVNETANTCEGSMSSADIEHIQSEQKFQQNKLTADGTEEKEEGWTGDDTKIDYVHGNEHAVLTNKDIPDIIHENEHDKDHLYLDTESANPCEGSISSFDEGHLKFGQNFQQNEPTTDGPKEKEDVCIDDYNKINCFHANEHIVVTNKVIAERIHENEHDSKNNSVHGIDHVVLTSKDIPDTIHENEHDKDPQYLDTESAKPCEGSISSIGDGHLKCGQSFQQNELTTDGLKEKDDSYIQDDNKINCFHANEHVVVTNKDIAYRIHENEHDKSMINPHYLGAESANLSEGGISPFSDGHLKSRESFQQHELTPDVTEEKKAGHTEDDNMTICVQADRPVAVAGFSSLSNERIHSKSPSFVKKKEEISCRYRASLLRQGLSLDAEDFNSIQNFIESQMDGTSSSLSSGSPSQGDLVLKTSNNVKTVDQLERLKKMDGLRDQLNRLSIQKGLEKRYQKKDLEYQPQQLHTYDAEQQFQSFDADSNPSSCTLDSYYGHRKPPMYPPPNPFSPAHSYAHYHFGHAQAHIPHNFDAWEFNSYYQSSQGGSSILDHDSLKSSFKEQKRVVRKHILRPLSGASPYTVCNSCFYLVQMPSDIYISKGKIGKMQCGKCSRVIVLSVPAVKHADANLSKELTQKSSKTDNRIVGRTESASYPVGVSEDYGASFTRSLSTRAGQALAATQSSKKVSDSALHLLMGYDSASQLLRHSRAFERHSRAFDDGYESFESMVPVSNRVSRRKNM
uniref:Uncharacterized protein n=1 Tax=Avena sativa TaxID=4498 RepID=A0ACD5W635_AVESA